ncbi:hypothetical protein [Billgrantia desiderata]|uniref:hypothetical protein n=1 Tax=Billgrantia desiderata TaxID=52021 RepID=UPI001F2D7657|nr:hypothetical protein [Halomonas desiderata]MCE8014326.1 hypothetical protein [Halomonas desiderata]
MRSLMGKGYMALFWVMTALSLYFLVNGSVFLAFILFAFGGAVSIALANFADGLSEANRYRKPDPLPGHEDD